MAMLAPAIIVNSRPLLGSGSGSDFGVFDVGVGVGVVVGV